MTDTEIRQLQNDRDFWRRKAQAIERKYAPVSGKSVLAFTAEVKGRKWVGETHFLEDAADSPRASNYLRDLERRIFCEHQGNEGAVDG